MLQNVPAKAQRRRADFYTTFMFLSLRLRAFAGTLSFYFNFFLTSAGTPATSESGGTSFVTTDPAPVTDRAPTRTGATSIVSEPILTSSSMTDSCLRVPSKLHVTVP